jgi:hypothetical protein
MCFFVTIGIPDGGAADVEESVPRGFALDRVANRSVLAKLPAHYRTYLLTTGGCSCALFSESASRVNVAAEDHATQLRRKYAKRGWSEAKVERAIAQAASKLDINEQRFVGLRSDACELLATFAERVGALAIVVHWYDGPLDTEKFAVAAGARVEPAALHEGHMDLVRDVMVFVHARRGRTSR